MVIYEDVGFLPCLNRVVLCFLLTNLTTTAGLSLVYFRGRGWHALIFLQSPSISWKEGSHLLFRWDSIHFFRLLLVVSKHHPSCDPSLIWSPVTITLFILVYCSKSSTLLSMLASRLSFSAFCRLSNFTSSTRSRIYCTSAPVEQQRPPLQPESPVASSAVWFLPYLSLSVTYLFSTAVSFAASQLAGH